MSIAARCALAAISITLTACMSVKVERESNWVPIKQADKTAIPESSRRSAEEVAYAAHSISMAEAGRPLRLTMEKGADLSEEDIRLTNAARRLDALAEELESERIGPEKQKKFSKKTFTLAMDSVKLYQSGDVEKLADVFETAIRNLDTRSVDLSANNFTDMDSAILRDQILKAGNRTRFVSTYLKAYFRGGRFAFAELKAGDIGDRLAKDFTDKIKAESNYDDLKDSEKALVDKIIARGTDSIKSSIVTACKTNTDSQCLLTSALGEEAFVTKGGRSIQFSGVGVIVGASGKASLSVEKPESTEVAAQLVEVMTEALWDAGLGAEVPAIATSTACANELLDKALCKGDEEFSKGVKEIYERADRASAYVTAVASQVVRGGWIVSLDNEALAKAVETAAGSNVRKYAEFWQYERHAQQGRLAAATGSEFDRSAVLSFNVD